jgi:hypothetical protein
MRQPSAHSKDQTGYAREDKTGRVLIRSGLRRKVLALDNALVEVPFRANGDFLYADQLSTGVVTIKLNNTSEDPIPFSAQSMVEDWPIEDVLISCAAQPGLVLNLWYGWRGRIRPPQSVVSLTGAVTLAPSSFATPQGPDSESINNHAFGKHRLVLAGGVGTFTTFGIENPVASGKLVLVDGVSFFNGASGIVSIATGAVGTGGLAASQHANPRLAGGAVSNFNTLTGTPAVLSGTEVEEFQIGPAGTTYTWSPNRPIAIPAGQGLYFFVSPNVSTDFNPWVREF